MYREDAQGPKRINNLRHCRRALDECPDTSVSQSSRERVLGPIEELVGPHLPDLRLRITSYSEIDI